MSNIEIIWIYYHYETIFVYVCVIVCVCIYMAQIQNKKIYFVGLGQTFKTSDLIQKVDYPSKAL